MIAGVPQPPVGMVAPAQLAGVFLYTNCALLALALVAAGFYRRAGDRLTPYGLIAGGALCVFNEAIVDRLGLCWFPVVQGPRALYHAFGVAVPLFMLPVYAWYVGGQAALCYVVFRRGVSRGGVLRLYGLGALLNLGLEAPGLNLGIYAYYGHQPLRLLLFPCWWAIANALMPLALAWFAVRMRAMLDGWRLLGLAIVAPPLALAVNAATVSPVWLALNSDAPDWLGVLAAMGALGLGLGVAHAIAAGVADRTAEKPRELRSMRTGEIIV